MRIIPLSRSAGGVRNTALELWTPSFGELGEVLSHPEIGPKDGSYFVRGPFNGVPRRADSHIPEANAIVLDADSRIDPDTGEVLTGAPHPKLAHEALVGRDIQHLIYTSHSHGSDKGDRYRILIPAELSSDHGALIATVDHVSALLVADGVPLAPVPENYVWAQPWYLPRIGTEGAEFLFYAHDTDRPLDVGAILSRCPPEEFALDFASEPTTRPPSTPIGRYVVEHGNPKSIGQRLRAAGYVPRGSTLVNGTPAFRFLHPGSQSGQPGVVLFRAANGIWRVVSFHGDHDPLREIDPRSGNPRAHDAFDLFRILEHDGSQARALAALSAIPAGEKRAFRLSHVSALLEEPAPLRWLVEDYALPESLCLLFGKPATGKSLVALDWAASIATGRSWCGHPVAQGPVIYIAGEGHFGIRRRLKAWAQHHDCEPELAKAPLFVSKSGAAFTEPKSLAEVREAIDGVREEHGAPLLIVIDTLHRNLGPSDENSAADMAKFVQAADELRSEFGAAVLVVHHSGHSSSERARGSSSLNAAVDSEYRLEGVGGDDRTLDVTKMKDGPTPPLKGFRLEQVTLPWLDASDTAETSVVLLPTETVPRRKPKSPPLSNGLRLAFAALVACCSSRETTPAQSAQPVSGGGMARPLLRDEG